MTGVDKNALVRKCVACGKCREYELFAKYGLPEGLDCETARLWAMSEVDERELQNKGRSVSGVRLYHVYYTSKFDGTQKDYVLDIHATSAKEARDTCWRVVHEKTGRHAFTIKAVLTNKRPVGYGEFVTNGYPPPKM